MRAILNFLAMMVAAVCNHLGGDLGAPAVHEAPSIQSHVTGASAAPPLSRLVASQPTPVPPMTVVKHSGQANDAVKSAQATRREADLSKVWALVHRNAVSQTNTATARAKTAHQSLTLEFRAAGRDLD